MVDIFSDAWAAKLGDALRTSDNYRRAARTWEGAVVLDWRDAPSAIGEVTSEDSGGSQRGVYLDLNHGDCHAARLATHADYERARFVLSTDREGWDMLLAGRIAPTMAILRGKLKVLKGSVGALMPHAQAATELVRVAQGIDRSARDAEPPVLSVPVAAAAVHAELQPTVPSDVSTERQGGRSQPLQSTSATGLRYDLFPMRLWEKAKRLGIWNPADIDFAQDRLDWQQLAADEQDMLLRLTALFQAGEECVTLDILPLLDVIAQEGRLEEQLYLTSFLWEEAKHVEAFRRFFDQVADVHRDLTHYHTASYRTIFADELPAAMGRLRTDRSPVAQARASVTYNMIVEGVLAETGYHVYHRVLATRGIMPGMQRVATLLKADESRHLAYGIYLLSRLVAEHGDVVWNAITQRMDELLAPAIEIINEAFAAYPPDNRPFGLQPETFVDYATGQFRKRMDRIELARRQSLADVQTLEPVEES